MAVRPPSGHAQAVEPPGVWGLQNGGLGRPLLEQEVKAPEPGPSPGSFSMVFVFPLPSVTTEDEEVAFRKAHLKNGMTHQALLRNALHLHTLHGRANVSCHCNLRSLRASVIELFVSFFETLGRPGPGCETCVFTSVDHDELFLCVRMAEELAETLADMAEYPLQLDKDALEKLGIKISQAQESLVPAYVKYDAHMKREGWLQTYPKHDSQDERRILRDIDHIRLLYNKVTDHIDINALMQQGLLLHVYSAHDLPSLLPIAEHWAQLRHIFSISQPIDEIRDYFGEEVAFYFLFLQTIIKGFRVLLVPGLICGALVWSGYENTSKVIFACTNIVWLTLLTKYWERQQAYYSNKWGADVAAETSSVKDPVNRHFHGPLRPSQLDENQMEFRPDRTKQLVGRMVSVTVTVAYMLVVIACMAANQSWAAWMHRQGDRQGFAVAAVCLSLQIKCFDILWGFVGMWLTQLEEHVTQHGFTQSMAVKTTAMKGINTFNAFVYVAYFKQWLDPGSCAGAGGCPALLKYNLLIVFASYIAFGFVDIAMPYVKCKLAIWWESRQLAKELRTGAEVPKLSYLEQQAKMSEYTGDDSTADYLQVIFPMAFVALFGAVMPAVPLILALVALSTQLFADSWKLIYVYRRPFPVRAKDIGVWNDILHIVGYLAIFNNLGLLLTQVEDLASYFPFLEGRSTVTVFFVLQNIFVALRLVFNRYVRSVDTATALEIRRQHVQRLRALQLEQGEFTESVEVQCNGRSTKSLASIPGLQPGDPHFVEPLV